MTSYLQMSAEQKKYEFEKIKIEYESLKSLGLSLDMSRGKPGFDQLDLSNEIFSLVNEDSGFKTEDGVDCRNYGGLDGIAENKKLFGEILGMDPENVIVGGNSSLNMMFDTIAQAMTHGMGGTPWCKQENIKFICPVPGYDRHFAITEYFGIEMIPVRNTPEGPDMDIIEELVKDEKVKGMWCVPKYSNPEGITYSDNTVRRIANMKPAAKDFRIMWDNAYAVHDLYDKGDELLNIYDECVKAGNPDMPFIFTSTSKITFPGAGVAAQACSSNNIKILKSRMAYQTIGPDKINQLRHAKMFKNIDDVKLQMKKHADILRPKFDRVLCALETELSGLGIASWNKPNGGYFVSLNVLDGCAKRVAQLCKDAGMVLTSAGATFPYGIDDRDSNLRIAPSFPSVSDIEKASNMLCVAVKYAALEKLLFE